LRGLDGVTAEIAHGDHVANTTLLRVMAGIYEPMAGTATIHGEVAPLFDVGLGMDRRELRLREHPAPRPLPRPEQGRDQGEG
jgi:ABC-type polysaccharide/polyol phosphate transport system ATPase subunit